MEVMGGSAYVYIRREWLIRWKRYRDRDRGESVCGSGGGVGRLARGASSFRREKGMRRWREEGFIVSSWSQLFVFYIEEFFLPPLFCLSSFV